MWIFYRYNNFKTLFISNFKTMLFLLLLLLFSSVFEFIGCIKKRKIFNIFKQKRENKIVIFAWNKTKQTKAKDNFTLALYFGKFLTRRYSNKRNSVFTQTSCVTNINKKKKEINTCILFYLSVSRTNLWPALIISETLMTDLQEK